MCISFRNVSALTRSITVKGLAFSAATLFGAALIAHADGAVPHAKDVARPSLPPASAIVVPVEEVRRGSTSASGSNRAPTLKRESKRFDGTLTTVRVENTKASEQSDVPITFGHIFAPGDLPKSGSLSGISEDGTPLPLQVDVKASHPDGSVRHAVISAVLPRLSPRQAETIGLMKTAAGSGVSQLSRPADLIDTGFTASVVLSVDGKTYTASADALFKSGKVTTWLAGPIANEWLVSTPFKAIGGTDHPHLAARFAIRAYAGQQKARVDVTIENNWAYEPQPRNFIYDARIIVGGNDVYTVNGMTHYHHARWRKVFWWGAAPQVHIKHDTAYLIASKAVPNYDQTIEVSQAALANMKAAWRGPKTEPMGTGVAAPYMPMTGGRPDIGLLPGWAVMYLLSMDERAKEIMLGTADLAGSWSAHYRDKKTDRPVSLLDYPYMTILGKPTNAYNPVKNVSEAFPVCALPNCATPNTHDTAHQPAFTYLPYLVTGDYYYLEELQFWAMYNTFSDNPGYRENIKGLFKPYQVRAQAWSLRTLGQIAYISPDNDPLKKHFERFLTNNLEWYNTTYTNNPNANALGVLTNGYALGYLNGTALAPWQDDFFTAAVGHVAELGDAKARELLNWKARFPISRMTDPNYCWIDAAIYSLKVTNTPVGPIYSDIGKAYQASHPEDFNSLQCASAEMTNYLKLKVGEMAGHSLSNIGFTSNLQPALAFSADSDHANGIDAWRMFAGRTVKPDYATGPQFAIVPRQKQ